MSAGWKAVLVGLGVMKITDLLKESVPWPVQPWVKSALTIMLGTALSVVLSDDTRTRLLVALGAVGVSSISHEVGDFLSTQGDRAKQEVMIRSLRPIR